MFSVGERPWTVRVFEHAGRKGVLYLRWWDQAKGNWRHRALKRTLRTAGGRILKHVQAWAEGEARKQHEALLRGAPPERRPTAQLTIAETWAVLTHPDTGLYTKDTPHRREVGRALQCAERIWGGDRPWNTLGKDDLRVLRRRRAAQLKEGGAIGLRGTEVTVSRILTVAEWLRDEGKIDERACLPERDWKKALRTELDAPDPARPRYSPEEMRALIRRAGEVDPRLGLAVALGAELRLGQVIRAVRTDLDLVAGTYRVGRRGKKLGATVTLTAGQLTVVRQALGEGYLRILEQTATDFPLFPAGQLRGGRKGEGVALAHLAEARPLNRRTLLAWWYELEALCGIPHVPGRAAYGVRRAAVDAAVAAGISRDALKEHGGWSDTQTPDRIYREQERVEARAEAARTRAEIRGEEKDGG